MKQRIGPIMAGRFGYGLFRIHITASKSDQQPKCGIGCVAARGSPVNELANVDPAFGGFRFLNQRLAHLEPSAQFALGQTGILPQFL